MTGPFTSQGIEVDGTTIFYTNDVLTRVKIGEITSDGTNGSSLTVSFVVDDPALIFAGPPPIFAARDIVTAGMIDELIGALTFGSTAPAAGTRTISVTVTDPGALVSNTAHTDITITLQNAVPVLTDLVAVVAIDPSVVATPQVVDSDVSLSDVDSTDPVSYTHLRAHET